MAFRTPFAAAVAGLALVLAGGVTSAARAADGASVRPAAATPGAAAARPAAITWAPAAKATVHPGVVVTVASVKCLAGFVFTQGRTVYLGIPASCTGVSDGGTTDGCSEAQVPGGVHAKIQGAKYRGTLVYSSFTTMALRGEKRANRCQNNSLSLIRLDRRDVKRTNPSMPVVGGPTGVSQAQPGLGVMLTVVLQAPTQAEAIATTSGGWAHTMTVDGEVNNLSVGAPVLTSDGKALGMIAVVPKQGAPGETTTGDIFRELQALHTVRGFRHVQLAKGTTRYSPSLLPF